MMKEMMMFRKLRKWERGCVEVVVGMSSIMVLLYIEKGANGGRAAQVRRGNATVRSKDCRRGYES